MFEANLVPGVPPYLDTDPSRHSDRPALLYQSGFCLEPTEHIEVIALLHELGYRVIACCSQGSRGLFTLDPTLNDILQEAAVIRRVRQHLGVKMLHPIAHSLGGFPVLQAALDEPDAFGNGIWVGPPAGTPLSILLGFLAEAQAQFQQKYEPDERVIFERANRQFLRRFLSLKALFQIGTALFRSPRRLLQKLARRGKKYLTFCMTKDRLFRPRDVIRAYQNQPGIVACEKFPGSHSDNYLRPKLFVPRLHRALKELAVSV